MTDFISIPSFYAGRTIFITGSTGFIGKVLLWKLLQSCSFIEKIYILLRPKRGVDVAIRREELLNCVIFDNFREAGNAEVLEKVVALSGDINLPNLGLSDDDVARLTKEVSIVFYSAALLKMDASLKDAINVNTEAVLKAIQISQQMKHLLAFVYVSTAYSSCDESEINEKLYPLNIAPKDILGVVRYLSESTLEKITSQIIDPLPNSYIFSKRIAELILGEFEGKLPIIIARPTIVISSLSEPVPGWVDNLNGPLGVAVATGKGVLRSMWIDPSKKTNIMPVDIVCNALVALPWREAQIGKKSSTVSVYNLASPESMELSWADFEKFSRKCFLKYPFEVMLWYPPDSVIEKNRNVHQMKVLLFHILPALIIDCLLFLLGRKRFMMRVQKKISSGLKVLTEFTTKQWKFQISNMEAIQESMTPSDRQTFPIILRQINYFDTAEVFLLGVKKYLLKENLNNLWKCRLQMKFLYALKVITTAGFYYFLWKLLQRLVNYCIEQYSHRH